MRLGAWVFVAGGVVASTMSCGSNAVAPTGTGGASGGAAGASGAVGRAGAGGGAGATAAGGAAGAGVGGGAGAAGSAGMTGSAGAGGASGSAGAAGGAGAGGMAGHAGTSGGGGNGGTSGGSAGSGGDGGGGGGFVTCDPNDQTTCPAIQRCAWIATSASAGFSACVPDGTVAQGGACAAGPYGATGYDDCKRGLACANAQCQPICKTSNDTCGAHAVCTSYSSVFSSGGSTIAGVCDPTCNPLTQARDYDGAPACGSPTPASPTLGCYGKSVFTCSKIVYPNNTADAPAAGPSSGGFYLNGCAPGYLPVLTAATGSTQQICVALCQPGPTSQAAPANAGGVAPATCAAAGAASPHECRYWWWLENTTLASFPDALSNTMGFCIDYTKYTGNKAGTGTAPYPSCTALSTTAHSYDATLTDTQYWGCEPHPGN